MYSLTDITISLGSNTISFSGFESSSSSIVSSDTSLDGIDLSNFFDGGLDDPSLGSPAFPEFNSENITEDNMYLKHTINGTANSIGGSN